MFFRRCSHQIEMFINLMKVRWLINWPSIFKHLLDFFSLRQCKPLTCSIKEDVHYPYLRRIIHVAKIGILPDLISRIRSYIEWLICNCFIKNGYNWLTIMHVENVQLWQFTDQLVWNMMITKHKNVNMMNTCASSDEL